ncbi:T9SS type A sorting domain-containing protein [Pontimicrobium aquaticum]|uniref:T9SS type A sorting domain-containing protein n=1 Tax=Pontimicrobium aquaticum TaxID=2565367 RepID=A0A4U0EYW4_9FLAO|nr:T9SS type A sorting domain-containing protein [Pontimicrobium aquaticum]TJY37236.1 T9SS type A sorting domain-containing protein [Pontimicrobium aquaticum]
MKKVCLVFIAVFISLSFNIEAQNITIINSQESVAHTMDQVWYDKAVGMGYSPTIVPQNTLNALSNLSATDVLIVASGTQTLSATQLQTVKDFISAGGPVYIQAEYLPTIAGSVNFESIMDHIGEDFSWTSSIFNSVTVIVSGELSTTPNSVTSFNGFSYGSVGATTSTKIEKFLEYSGMFVGFSYHDDSSSNGDVITTSDQDWLRLDKSPELVGNMLNSLVQSTAPLSIIKNEFENSIIGYPNPTNGDFLVDFKKEYSLVNVDIINVNGQLISSEQIQNSKEIKLNFEKLRRGFYFTKITADKKTTVLKVLKK